jgi:hypothetical protein
MAIDSAVASAGDTSKGLLALKEFLEALLGYVNAQIAAQGQ